MSRQVSRGSAGEYQEMSRQVSRGSAGEYQADEQAPLTHEELEGQRTVSTCLWTS